MAIVTRDVHVRRAGSDYAKALLELLPYGPAWPRAVGSTLVMAINGLADYYGFVDSRAADLLERESDPRKTFELLPDWERNWGLPDPCFHETISLSDRQRMLVFKMTLFGGQSRDFYINDVAWGMLGYKSTISEYAPFMAGVSRAGDTRPPAQSAADPGGLHGDFRWYIGPASLRFYWTVHVSTTRVTWFRASSGQAGVDPHCRIAKATDLECLLNRWKPAQTQIVFDYANMTPPDPMYGTP